jgi:hypothetical protein
VSTAYLVLSRIFLIAGKIGESLWSYQEYSAESVDKQGEEFLIAAQEIKLPGFFIKNLQ